MTTGPSTGTPSDNDRLSPWKRWTGLPLWLQTLIGMILGIITGIWLGTDAQILKPVGTLFVNAIKMLIVPLVFCSLVVGVSSMEDTNKMGRIGLKTLVFYLFTTAIAITLGLVTIFTSLAAHGRCCLDSRYRPSAGYGPHNSKYYRGYHGNNSCCAK